MEEEEKTSIDYQKEAKEIVKKELEKSGVINYMRAKLKKSVIDIIDHQKETTKQKLEFDFMTPLHRLNKPKEIVLLCQLIKEFLKFYELEYTLPIFENESNVKESVKRETLLNELKFQEPKDNNKPVLLLLLLDRLNNDNRNSNLNRYDFNSYSSNYNKPAFENVNEDINKLNNQLNPTQFGSTNKSLDMSNNSQNSNPNIQNNNIQNNNQNNNQGNNQINNINNNIKPANINLIDDENENNNNNDAKNDNNAGNEKKNGIIGISPNQNNKKVSKYNDQYQEALLDVTGGK